MPSSPVFEELPLTPEMTASIRRAGRWETPAAVIGAVLLASWQLLQLRKQDQDLDY